MKKWIVGTLLTALSFTFLTTQNAEAGTVRASILSTKNSLHRLNAKARYQRALRNSASYRANRCARVRGYFALRCRNLRHTAAFHQRKLNRIHGRLSILRGRLSHLRRVRRLRRHRRSCVTVHTLFGRVTRCSRGFVNHRYRRPLRRRVRVIRYGRTTTRRVRSRRGRRSHVTVTKTRRYRNGVTVRTRTTRTTRFGRRSRR